MTQILARWRSTPVRTFLVYPAALWVLEASVRRTLPPLDPRGLPLMAWGYLQFRACGRYRTRLGGGGPGPSVPPDRIVTSGLYRYTRNPMYLGHLIFLSGVALTLHSRAALGLTAGVAVWFDRRVRADEAQLKTRFGAEYADYRRRVRRWLPGLF